MQTGPRWSLHPSACSLRPGSSHPCCPEVRTPTAWFRAPSAPERRSLSFRGALFWVLRGPWFPPCCSRASDAPPRRPRWPGSPCLAPPRGPQADLSHTETLLGCYPPGADLARALSQQPGRLIRKNAWRPGAWRLLGDGRERETGASLGLPPGPNPQAPGRCCFQPLPLQFQPA